MSLGQVRRLGHVESRYSTLCMLLKFGIHTKVMHMYAYMTYMYVHVCVGVDAIHATHHPYLESHVD